jgi:hypothetical protein
MIIIVLNRVAVVERQLVNIAAITQQLQQSVLNMGRDCAPTAVPFKRR